MQCPKCGGKHIRKNRHRRGKQNHICVTCARNFCWLQEKQGLE